MVVAPRLRIFYGYRASTARRANTLTDLNPQGILSLKLSLLKKQRASLLL